MSRDYDESQINCINSFIVKVDKYDMKEWDGHIIVSYCENKYILKFINNIDIYRWKFKEIYTRLIFDEINSLKSFFKLLVE